MDETRYFMKQDGAHRTRLSRISIKILQTVRHSKDNTAKITRAYPLTRNWMYSSKTGYASDQRNRSI